MELECLPLKSLKRRDVPAGPGTYVIYDDSGGALYVGESGNLRSRVFGDHLSHHSSLSAFRRSLGAHLGLGIKAKGRQDYLPEQEKQITVFLRDTCTIAILPQSTKGRAVDLQAELIDQLAPVLNVQGRSHVRPRLTHLDSAGRARMVDVSAKADTARVAVARGSVRMRPETLALIRSGRVEKGDVLAVARLAGVMAAKKTHELIPLCHPLLLTDIDVQLCPDEAESAVHVEATVRSTGKTGVEMEALTAVAVAALTIYDMCKAADRAMRIEGVRLVKKSGGKSGEIILE